ncbi:MAG: hypothetical protein OQK69_05310 [Gammaproteobacteria bacterium]|nr:hypothetical protein [Gammaproteobacteria bacterium]
MTTKAREFNRALYLTGVMLLISADAQAGLTGQLEATLESNNSQFDSESSLEERLDLFYQNVDDGLSANLSLVMAQQSGNDEAELYQLYLQQDMNDSADQISLGRFFRADTLGYYSLDGVQYRHRADKLIMSLYAGVPGRIEAFRSIDADTLYGVNLQTLPVYIIDYEMDANLGWQRLEQDSHEQRYHFGWRANSDNETNRPLPAAVSMSASYVEESSQWEAVQIKTRWDLEEDDTLRIDYETYEPASNELSFRDQFYSLYARGNQTQFKAAYQFDYDYQQTWSMAARRVNREYGGSGYAGVLAVEQRSSKGLLFAVKAEQLKLQSERVASLFLDVDKTLGPSVRGGVSGVIQQQQKQLVGDNRSLGIELYLEHMVSVNALPSDLHFNFTASHIWNSRLEDEYRMLLSLGYSFGGAKQGMLQ